LFLVDYDCHIPHNGHFIFIRAVIFLIERNPEQSSSQRAVQLIAVSNGDFHKLFFLGNGVRSIVNV
jgi:hypothetical protein